MLISQIGAAGALTGGARTTNQAHKKDIERMERLYSTYTHH